MSILVHRGISPILPSTGGLGFLSAILSQLEWWSNACVNGTEKCTAVTESAHMSLRIDPWMQRQYMSQS